MSSIGQAVGGAVGAVAGFFIGGPTGAMYGAQIGMMAGGIIDPPKGPDIKGPRLDDLTVQTSTYGTVIPRIYGTLAVTGNVFWLENNKLKETTKKSSSGGKGGQPESTTTTYSYSATFAVGLCDCAAAPIIGVRRIWIAGRLWYDAGSSDQDAIIVSNAAAQYFTLHTGSDTQLPDDRMQATLGVANTPAYRGLAYIVFRDLPLAEYSNSLMGAQVKVEVIASGAVQNYVGTYRNLPSFQSWDDICWNGRIFCAVAGKSSTSTVCATSPDGITWTSRAMPIAAYWTAIAWNGTVFCAITSNMSNKCATSPDGITWTMHTMSSSSNWCNLCWNGTVFVSLYAASAIYSTDGVLWNSGVVQGGGFFSPSIAWNGVVFVAVQSGGSDVLTSPNGAFWTLHSGVMPASNNWHRTIWNGSIFLCISYYDSVQNVCATSPDGVTWTIHPLPIFQSMQYTVVWTGIEFYIPMWNSSTAISSPDGITWTSHPSKIGAWMSAAWNGALICVPGNNTAIAMTVVSNFVASISPTLASIVTAEVVQSNILTSSDIDVSALTRQVRGYRIASVAALRSGIDPLQGAFPFDVIQHGYIIRFKPRGGSSVATIPAADLDARGSGESPGVSITNVREMDSVLPQCVRVSFLDVAREYDTNEQSEQRLNTDAVNISSIELAIVLTSTEAAGIAQVLLYLYWMERYDVAFSLPPTYNSLEPGDVITVQASEATYSLRLTAITYTQDGRLECSAKYNSAATYTPTAVGVSGSATAQTLTRTGDSALVLIDMPTMLDTSDRPGYVAAMTGESSGWNGGTIYRTDDGGQTWATMQGFTAPGSSIGYAGAAIGAGRTDIFDTTSALSVIMLKGALSSVSESVVLNGGNYFAYGVDGRWEIIAAKTCTLQGDGSYILTDLLRGRKGTEWACGLHAASDALVALSVSDVSFISASLDSIGAARTYRGVTSGQQIDAASDLPFTYAGVNLECLAPCYLNGSRDPSSNDWSLTWIRRTRIGSEWRDNVDATLGEASEAYEVEIYATSGFAAVKRTLTGLTSAAASYPSAQQVADFGSNQATLYLKIYQLSATVGRGYPLTMSITR